MPGSQVPGQKLGVTKGIGSLRASVLPVCEVELATAGHGVPDAGAAEGVGWLHNDKGAFLQGGHHEVLGVIHRLQEAAISRPQWVLEP